MPRVNAFRINLLTDANGSVPSGSDVDSNPGETFEAQPEQIGSEEVLEPWVDWIRRVTHRVEEQARKLNIQNWTTRARAAKWKWARQIASHGPDRWTRKLLFWEPEFFFDGTRGLTHRRQGRPSLRWIDEIRNFVQHKDNTTQWE